MEFTVEFYETESGTCPVREFLDDLKSSDPDDFAAVLAGLAKLRNRQYHREPLHIPLNPAADSERIRPPLGAPRRRASVLGLQWPTSVRSG